MKSSSSRNITFLLATLLITGCAVLAKNQFDALYGSPAVVDRTMTEEDFAAGHPEYYRDIKPIVDSRCVVCHGCYDAPCQLKMSSFESIDRGASKKKVYDGARLLAANLTRVSIDASSTQQWRDDGFFPVLNEREQSPEANTQASTMYRMLQLKQAHPLPEGDVLPDTFDFALDRKQQCTKIENFAAFEQKFPLWGMPYGLPAIESDKQEMLEKWLETGAKATYPGVMPTANQSHIDEWESFLNGESLKQRLMSRYIFEHLFLANLYFSNTADRVGEEREFFKLVRSTTATGSPVQVIPTRRPFDDPGGEFYYRLVRVKSTILAKQSMPYLLDQQRRVRWTELFLEPDYAVKELPSYEPKKASNPFLTFIDLPIDSRYKFMLDEAQFTIMGFIKGPVCRGQVALNVINDHFWVIFVNPEAERENSSAEFLAREAKNLQLPAEKESTALRPISSWLRYSAMEKEYRQARNKRLDEIFTEQNKIDLSVLWDGNGNNPNAALTVYRHFDSSTVIKGLVGDTPKTAWLISYPLLERIHYLLVAGFDVYGNAGHQLLTRLYMDFLRMEGEYNFLRLLPADVAERELDFWYRGAESKVEEYLDEIHSRPYETSGLRFKTDNPKKEVFDLIRARFGENVIPLDNINSRPVAPVSAPYQKDLQQLAAVKGITLNHLPEQSVVRLSLDSGEVKLLSMLRNRAHSNVSQLLGEEKRVIPEEQTLSVVEDIVGSYPNAFYDIAESELGGFVESVSTLASEEDYRRLVSRYGVRRTDKGFWKFSDSVHAEYFQSRVIDAGYLDYNRIENR